MILLKDRIMIFLANSMQFLRTRSLPLNNIHKTPLRVHISVSSQIYMCLEINSFLINFKWGLPNHSFQHLSTNTAKDLIYKKKAYNFVTLCSTCFVHALSGRRKESRANHKSSSLHQSRISLTCSRNKIRNILLKPILFLSCLWPIS